MRPGEIGRVCACVLCCILAALSLPEMDSPISFAALGICSSLSNDKVQVS